MAALLALLLATPARAEVGTITVARQFGIAYLPFLIMEEDHLIEKHAAALGLPGFHVDWVVLSSGAAANDGLLSGQLAFGVGAVPAMLLLWDRTRTSSNAVFGVTGVAVMPTVLNSRNPAVHSIKDLTPADKIALPAIKVSNHALVLEMAAAAAFGPDNWARFDPLTVSMPQPDAATALMSRAGEITAHFTSPPFTLSELRAPGVHKVLNSFDVMGDTSLTVLWATRRFATANPRVVQAMYDAVQDALATINADKRAAADRYLRLSGDKISRDDLLTVLDDPHVQFNPAPLGTMAFARFMQKTGALKTVPAAWSDLFFPIAHSLPGT
jgi:NitT/TauT family transport system substrate-binding protein